MEKLKYNPMTNDGKKLNEVIDRLTLIESTIDSDTGEVAATMIGNAANTGQELTAEVTITPANIVAMYTTPVEVLPAPGAGKVIEVLSAVLIYDFLTAAYTGGGVVTLAYGSGGATITANIAAANSFAASGDKVYPLSVLNAAGGISMPVNTPVVITNASGVFVNPGTAAGVGRLHIVYRIHTTGL